MAVMPRVGRNPKVIMRASVNSEGQSERGSFAHKIKGFDALLFAAVKVDCE
jgi:hypothetical protein